MKKEVIIILNYCVVCGRMYDEDKKLIRSDLLRYMLYQSAHKNVKIKIRKGTCGICQN